MSINLCDGLGKQHIRQSHGKCGGFLTAHNSSYADGALGKKEERGETKVN